MFKISEVAGKLNVETYEIFEKLLTHAELLKDHTQKIHSVSYIDEQGIEIIQALIEGKSPSDIQALDTLQETSEKADKLQNLNHTTDDSVQENSGSGLDDDMEEDWLTEDDFLILDQEKSRLRDEVSSLRQELIQYDSELKRLDDIIENYQILMKEDLERLTSLDEMVEKVLLRKSMEEVKDEPSGMFGFMRR